MGKTPDAGIGEQEDAERYGSIYAWSKTFGISHHEIRRRLEGIIGISARSAGGALLNCGFYSEQIVRERCANLLTTPQADDNGFYIRQENGEMIRYSSISGWARELNTSIRIIDSLKDAPFIMCKASSGQLHKFYAEHVVHKLCGNQIRTLPEADEEGFFTAEWNGQIEKFGNIYSWSKKLEIPSNSAHRKLKGLSGIQGRDNQGQIRHFIPESLVQNLFKNEPEEIGELNDHKFLMQKKDDGTEERYGTISAWANELGINGNSIQRKINKEEGIARKTNNGHRAVLYFYPESIIRERFQHFMEELPRSDQDGFFRKNGMLYGNASAWASKLHTTNFKMRFRLKDILGISGRTFSGNPLINGYYSESVIREHCVDLLPPNF